MYVLPFLPPGDPSESLSTAKESKIHAIDFASASADSYAGLKSVVASLDGQIGVLVNNVGVSHSHPVYFHECPESEMQNVVEINVNATMRITRMVLPNMLEKWVSPQVRRSRTS